MVSGDEKRKDDKLAWFSQRQSDGNIQKHLLVIHEHGARFPNAGSLLKPLEGYLVRIANLSKHDNPLPLISIVVDIAYRNPRAYAVCAAILSKLISFLNTPEEKQAIIEKTRRKFSRLPNTGHMHIWLQRISIPFAPDIKYDESLCRLVSGEDVSIWNSEWVSAADLKSSLNAKRLSQKID